MKFSAYKFVLCDLLIACLWGALPPLFVFFVAKTLLWVYYYVLNTVFLALYAVIIFNDNLRTSINDTRLKASVFMSYGFCLLFLSFVRQYGWDFWGGIILAFVCLLLAAIIMAAAYVKRKKYVPMSIDADRPLS